MKILNSALKSSKMITNLQLVLIKITFFFTTEKPKMHFFLVRAAQIFHSIAISIVTCVVKLMVVIVSQVHFSNPKTSTSLLCMSFVESQGVSMSLNESQ